jgi:cysteinyl-tRNA synthetase
VEKLKDNVDTKSCLSLLLKLISSVNRYMDDNGASCCAELLNSSSSLVTEWLSTFGLFQTESKSSTDEAAWNSFVQFRAEVRNTSLQSLKDGMKSVPSTVLLKLCDKARDEALAKHNVIIEDTKDGSSRWKMNE